MITIAFITMLMLAVGVQNSSGPNESLWDAAVPNEPQKNNAAYVRLGNNGRAIVQAIIAANLERESLSMGDVWPIKKSRFKVGQWAGTEYHPATSDEYFADLLESEAIEGVTWPLFTGGAIGVPAAENEKDFRAGGKNAWSYITLPDGFPEKGRNSNEYPPDDMPFLVTKNLRITSDDLRNYNPDMSLADKLDRADEKVVAVTYGGSVRILDEKALQKASNLFGSTSAEVIRKAVAVHPK